MIMAGVLDAKSDLSQSRAAWPFASNPAQRDIAAEIVFEVRFGRTAENEDIAALNVSAKTWPPVERSPDQALIAAARIFVVRFVHVALKLLMLAASDLHACFGRAPAKELIAAAIACPVCFVSEPAKVDIAAARDLEIERTRAPAKLDIAELSSLSVCFVMVPANELMAALKVMTNVSEVASVADQAAIAPARALLVCFAQAPAKLDIAAASTWLVRRVIAPAKLAMAALKVVAY